MDYMSIISYIPQDGTRIARLKVKAEVEEDE